MDGVLDPLVVVLLNSKLEFIKGVSVVSLPRFLDLTQLVLKLTVSLLRVFNFILELRLALLEAGYCHALVLKADSLIKDL